MQNITPHNYKILITDMVHNELIERLENLGFQVDYLPNISYNELKSIIKNYDVVIVRSRTKITKDIIQAIIVEADT